MDVVYEDNHIIVVNRRAGELVQGDKTGGTPRFEILKRYLKEKYQKPGNVFCGVVHRIDRPVSGLVIFAKTSKSLESLTKMLRDGEIHKTYRAVVKGFPEPAEALLENMLVSTGRKHQICVQLSAMGHPIKGDVKYGAWGSNRDGGISLQAWQIRLVHPVSGEELVLTVPDELTIRV